MLKKVVGKIEIYKKINLNSDKLGKFETGNAKVTSIMTPVTICPIYGAYPKRLKYMGFERPAKTFVHNVNNIFTNKLSIRESRKVRLR